MPNENQADQAARQAAADQAAADRAARQAARQAGRTGRQGGGQAADPAAILARLWSATCGTGIVPPNVARLTDDQIGDVIYGQADAYGDDQAIGRAAFALGYQSRQGGSIRLAGDDLTDAAALYVPQDAAYSGQAAALFGQAGPPLVQIDADTIALTRRAAAGILTVYAAVKAVSKAGRLAWTEDGVLTVTPPPAKD